MSAVNSQTSLPANSQQSNPQLPLVSVVTSGGGFFIKADEHEKLRRQCVDITESCRTDLLNIAERSSNSQDAADLLLADYLQQHPSNTLDIDKLRPFFQEHALDIVR